MSQILQNHVQVFECFMRTETFQIDIPIHTHCVYRWKDIIYIYIYETTRVYIYTCFFWGAGFGKLFGASDKNKTNKETRRNETCRSKNNPRSIWGLYFESSKYIRIDVGVFSFNVKI